MPAFTAASTPVVGDAKNANFEAHNVLFQWISILMPSTLGVEALNSVELAKELLQEGGANSSSSD